MPNKLLSKSKYLNGLQCPKYLWIACNDPSQIPQPDPATQRIFDQGHLVGELAKQLFPGGVDLPADDFTSNLVITNDILRQRKPMFEGGVLSGRIYSRVDILNPVNEDEWDIIEVKSATSVKDINIHDVSFQKRCWENVGVKIRKCFLACINNQYVKQGEIIPEQLLAIHDVTADVEIMSVELGERINKMLAIIDQPVCPQMDIGLHCSDPYDCQLKQACWQYLPEDNVFTLYYGGKKAHELYSSGVLTVSDIPADFKLNDKQRIQCSCVASGQPYIDQEAIREFLDIPKYPLYYLDFETIGTAVPIFDGTRPYQNIPFQFSLHIQPTPGDEPSHIEFLAEAGRDPRPALLVALKNAIGPEGHIVAYNKSFEESVLKALGDSFPEYKPWIDAILPRFVDLIIPFRGFHYYHPTQQGSASLKKVLPAVTGLSYENMTIGKGDDASNAYLDVVQGNVPEAEISCVRQQLLDYCKLDTEGMVRIVDELRRLVEYQIK